MKGHVPTPDPLADHIVSRLFDGGGRRGRPRALPGVGEGPFVAAVERYCDANNLPVPDGVGIEIDSDRADTTRETRDIRPSKQTSLATPAPSWASSSTSSATRRTSRSRESTRTRRNATGVSSTPRSTGSTSTCCSSNARCRYSPTMDGSCSSPREVRVRLDGSPCETSSSSTMSNSSSTSTRTPSRGTSPFRRSPSSRSRSYGGETRIMRRNGTEAVVDLPRDGSSWASTVRGVRPRP